MCFDPSGKKILRSLLKNKNLSPASTFPFSSLCFRKVSKWKRRKRGEKVLLNRFLRVLKRLWCETGKLKTYFFSFQINISIFKVWNYFLKKSWKFQELLSYSFSTVLDRSSENQSEKTFNGIRRLKKTKTIFEIVEKWKTSHEEGNER